jgi:hypothetical protein
MDEPRNASVEEATNNSTEKQLVSDTPSFGIKELKASKRGRKVVKPMAKWVSTIKTTRQALKATFKALKKVLIKFRSNTASASDDVFFLGDQLVKCMCFVYLHTYHHMHSTI